MTQLRNRSDCPHGWGADSDCPACIEIEKLKKEVRLLRHLLGMPIENKKAQ